MPPTIGETCSAHPIEHLGGLEVPGGTLAASGERIPNFARYQPGTAGCQFAEERLAVDCRPNWSESEVQEISTLAATFLTVIVGRVMGVTCGSKP